MQFIKKCSSSSNPVLHNGQILLGSIPPGIYHEHWTKCSQENEVRTNISTTSLLRNFEILTAVFEFYG